MKRFLLPVALVATWTAASCSSPETDSSTFDSPAMNHPADSSHAHGHQHGAGTEGPTPGASTAHTYACPMHPDVTSDQPGECPKCGMTLQPIGEAAGTGKTFQMNFSTTPAQPAAGQPITLSFRPQVVGSEQTPVPLAVSHEQELHLMVLPQDLSEYDHIHPVLQPSGRYEVPFTFKTGGTYLLYQDYQPEGGGHQLGRQTLQVSGPTRPAVKFSQDKMRWEHNGYSADLAFDKPVRVGQPLAVRVTVAHNGRPVTDLDHYLGALGHMVILSEDGKQYLHVHPEDQADQGPRIGFHTTFEQAGLYRVFLQFQHAGEVQTADFTVNVAPAAA